MVGGEWKTARAEKGADGGKDGARSSDAAMTQHASNPMGQENAGSWGDGLDWTVAVRGVR